MNTLVIPIQDSKPELPAEILELTVAAESMKDIIIESGVILEQQSEAEIYTELLESTVDKSRDDVTVNPAVVEEQESEPELSTVYKPLSIEESTDKSYIKI